MTIAACAEIVRKGDPDRFLATMAGPIEAREKLFPLYAFNVEVSRAPWLTAEPLIAEMRLQWWLDVLDEIENGSRVRSHEVATPLSALISPQQARSLKPLIESRKWDIKRNPFPDLETLYSHIDQSSGTLADVASVLLGGPQSAARDLGNAQGAAAWLRAVPALFTQNRQPLPGDMISSVQAISIFGLQRLQAARRQKKDIPKSALPAFWVGFDTPLFLRSAHRSPASILSGEIAVSEFRRKFRLLRLSLTNTW